jgi:MoxR-like ATPase
LDAIRWALGIVANQEYLEAPEASMAVAAAAVVASILDGKFDAIPEDARSSVEQLVSERAIAEEFRKPILKVLERVLAANSELKELWAETDELSDWEKTLQDIRDRIDKS